MIGKPIPAVRGKLLALAAGFLALTWTTSFTRAQTSPGGGSSGAKPSSGFADGSPIEDPAVTPAGCSSCGGGGGLIGKHDDISIPAGVVNGGCGSGGCGNCGC